MATYNFSPVFNAWQGFTPSGLPLSGGFLYTYQAGTSTPANTYTTSVGNIANSNPIALLSDGRVPNEIWLDSALAYKFTLTDSLFNQIGTYDNIIGIDNTVPSALSEWVAAGTPSYVSASTFTISGNQTSLFEVGRRVRYTLTSGQYTGYVTSSVFGAITTVVIAVDSIPIDATLSAVAYGFLDALKPSVPTAFLSPVSAPSVASTGSVSTGTNILSPSQAGCFSAYTSSAFNIGQSSTPVDVIYGTEEYDNSNSYNNVTGVFTAPVAGRYLVNFSICPQFDATSAAGITMTAILKKNGSTVTAGRGQVTAEKTVVAGAITQIGPVATYSYIHKLAVSDTLKWQATYSDAISITCSATPAYFSVEFLG